ncbi:unnamed protein product [Thelazia callipaeda]|uniref:BHLH domain-containing protein n=1 Tax=Thelazia callipaeda TaxID=103827 RepID=A0A0N5DAF7_THECL|nr:unnamed protein product [Thelazia callipaeda]
MEGKRKKSASAIINENNGTQMRLEKLCEGLERHTTSVPEVADSRMITLEALVVDLKSQVARKVAESAS